MISRSERGFPLCGGVVLRRRGAEDLTQSTLEYARKAIRKCPGVGGPIAVEQARLFIEKMRGIFLECALALAQRGQCGDQFVLRINFEHRLRGRSESTRAGEDPFEGAVRSFVRRDQTDSARGEAVGSAYFCNRIPESQFDESEKILDWL